MALDHLLLEVLACPEDKGPLIYFADEDRLYNPRLHRSYAVRDDIPVMLVDEATTVDDAEHSRLMAKAEKEGLAPTLSTGGDSVVNSGRGLATADVVDSLGMFAATAGLPEQVAGAVSGARDLEGLPDHEYVEQVVVLGMGGSGMAGDLMVAVAGPFVPVPIVVVKSYDLPDFVGPGSLVFALSFSGDTEEVVEAAGEAAGSGANVVAVTSGGELARLAAEWAAPTVPVPGDIPQPRAAPRGHGHPTADRPRGDRPLPRRHPLGRARRGAAGPAPRHAGGPGERVARSWPAPWGGRSLWSVGPRPWVRRRRCAGRPRSTRTPKHRPSPPSTPSSVPQRDRRTGDRTGTSPARSSLSSNLRHDAEHPAGGPAFRTGGRQSCGRSWPTSLEVRAEGAGDARSAARPGPGGGLRLAAPGRPGGHRPGPRPAIDDRRDSSVRLRQAVSCGPDRRHGRTREVRSARSHDVPGLTAAHAYDLSHATPDDSPTLTSPISGHQRIAWADSNMPVLQSIRERFAAKERPLEGVIAAACLHVTTETANLLRTLKAGGAVVLACASNPLSTQDDVAASLVRDEGIATYAVRGEDTDRYFAHIDAALDAHPTVTMDDGCDLVSRLHQTRPEQVGEVIAGTEETTTGVIRLRAMENEAALKLPDRRRERRRHEAHVRQPLRNRAVDPRRRHPGRPTSCSPARGSSSPATATAARAWPARARGMGAQRHRHRESTRCAPSRRSWTASGVEPMDDAAAEGEIFITVTGNRDVLRAEHFERDARRRHRGQLGSLRRRDRPRRARQAGRGPASRRSGPIVEEFPGPGGQAGPRHRRRSAREPVRRRGPPGRRDGHVLRQPGPGGRMGDRRTPRPSSPRCTTCRRASTPRSPGSSSRRWASPSIALPRPRRSTWDPGRRAPDPPAQFPGPPACEGAGRGHRRRFVTTTSRNSRTLASRRRTIEMWAASGSVVASRSQSQAKRPT